MEKWLCLVCFSRFACRLGSPYQCWQASLIPCRLPAGWSKSPGLLLAVGWFSRAYGLKGEPASVIVNVCNGRDFVALESDVSPILLVGRKRQRVRQQQKKKKKLKGRVTHTSYVLCCPSVRSSLGTEASRGCQGWKRYQSNMENPR